MEVTIESLQAENEHLTARLQKAAEIFGNYKNDFATLNAKLAELTEENQKLSTTLREKEEALFNMEEDVRVSKAMATEAVNEINKLKTERDEALTKFSEQVTNTENLLDENTKLKEELNQIKTVKIPNMKTSITNEIENIKASTKKFENNLISNFDLFA